MPRRGDPAIRAARAVDGPAVLAVWSIARSAHATAPDFEPDIERLLERDPDALLVAEVEGTIVGVLVAGWDGWRGNLYRLAVLPPFRRRGLGLALVRRAERRLQSLGCHRVSALVGEEDEDAVAFWEAAGYAHDASVARLVKELLPPG
jgi:ribosomal protein S18 acetylase RimI-like enzyme